MVLKYASMKMKVFWVVAIALMIESLSTFETLVELYKITRPKNSEDGYSHALSHFVRFASTV
jgi:hypothetical protein